MRWAIREAGERYQLFDRDEQRTVDGIQFVRWDRAEQVRQILEKNELDLDAANCEILTRMRSSGQP